MRSVNVVHLLGNVGNDPEVRTTSNGAKVATFSLATGRQWKDASGEKQEKTEWHKCVVWGNAKSDGLAGVVEKYVGKGVQVYVTGRIEYRQWEKDGVTKYGTDIIVTDLVLLGGGNKAKASEPEPEPQDEEWPF